VNNYLTEGDRKYILRLYQIGMNIRQITQLTGRSRRTVQRCLGEWGVAWGDAPGRPTERVTTTVPGGDFQED
jgi:transposase